MKLKSLVVFLLIFSITSLPVVAQSPGSSTEDTTTNQADVDEVEVEDETTDELLKEKKEGIYRRGDLTKVEREEKINEFKEQNEAKKCELIEEKLNKWTEMYDSKHASQIERLDNLQAKLLLMLDKFDDIEIDTSVVRADLDYINTEKEQIKLKQQEFVLAIKSAKSAGCVDREQLKTMMDEAFEILSERKAMSKNLHDFIKTDFKEDVGALKEQVKLLKLELKEGESEVNTQE